MKLDAIFERKYNWNIIDIDSRDFSGLDYVDEVRRQSGLEIPMGRIEPMPPFKERAS